MDRCKIETTVLSVLTAVLKCPVDQNGKRKDYPQWDSLKHFEVIFAIEDELNFRFPEDCLPTLDGVEKMVETILTLQNAS